MVSRLLFMARDCSYGTHGYPSATPFCLLVKWSMNKCWGPLRACCAFLFNAKESTKSSWLMSFKTFRHSLLFINCHFWSLRARKRKKKKMWNENIKVTWTFFGRFYFLLATESNWHCLYSNFVLSLCINQTVIWISLQSSRRERVCNFPTQSMNKEPTH